MVTTPSQLITLEDFLALPETKPAREYIDGKVIQKPMPKGKHSTIQGELTTALNSILKPQKIARAFPELRYTFGGRSTVPDVTVFTWKAISRDDNDEISDSFQIAPDWTIEILSPDQSQTRVTKNILHCLDNGTKLGWLIDPGEQSVLVYFPKQQPAFLEVATDVLPVPDFAKAFHLTLGELFGWLLE
ncbi:Uma2 family endonuclease [Pleurocapsa sp. PCC 7319]|uniref:Uma2 family endonuclease n=1 Tax=Pleurocapsa sp. PCC 7319 TaxID=118161 RepID=UPI00034C2F96|nr:Uma2 family endonuclease [Pleurocapsa sp. PCC 7319]